MKIGYIKQFQNEEELLSKIEEQYPKIIKRIVTKAKKILDISNIIELEDSIIVVLPISEKSKLTNRKINRIIRKIRKRTYIQNVAISNFLFNDTRIKKCIEENKLYVFNGKWLWDHIVLKLVQYVCKNKKELLQKQEVTIAVKENTEINIQNIIKIAKNVKFVNIITPNIRKFKMIEEFLYSTDGIVVRVTSNKKTIIKSNIIINIDFSEEELNKYTIPDNAVILNRNNHINIKSKKFSGINCSSFKINWNEENIKELKEYNIYNYFDKNILYESVAYHKDSYNNICMELEKDGVEIVRINRDKRNYK